MKKAFICAHANFPRGGAEANYIEYLALALIRQNYEVFIFSRGKNREEDWNEDTKRFCYNGIFYRNVEGAYSSTLGFVKEYFAEGRKKVGLLKEYQAGEGDILLFYSINYFYIRTIYQFARKRNIKTAMCITEWHQPFQYKHGRWNPIYWLENIGFEYGVPMSKNVIPISNYLAQYFQKKKCKTLCLPIMADCSMIKVEDKSTDRITDEKVHFIYSGNPFQKDSIEVILDSFCALSESDRRIMQLHFTGMGSNTVQKLWDNYGKQLELLKDSVCIHGWMSYEKLTDLYDRIDFLVLFRQTNKVTLSNFPSKVPEMMIHGIIPIVSKVGDYTDLYLRDEVDCLMIDTCTQSAGKKILEKAIHLSREEKSLYKSTAMKTVKERFDYRNWSEKIADFLENE